MKQRLTARRVDLLLALTILIGATFVVITKPGTQATAAPDPLIGKLLDLPAGTTEGSAAAPVVILEYSDFQCPFCKKFTEMTLPTLRNDYVSRGAVAIAFRNLPLAQIHPHARAAADGVACAAEQGRFGDMHDRLFRAPVLSDSTSNALAADLNLDLHRFAGCMGGVGKQAVDHDIDTARTLGITATPSFLIGRRQEGRLLKVEYHTSGLPPIEAFTAVLDRLLK